MVRNQNHKNGQLTHLFQMRIDEETRSLLTRAAMRKGVSKSRYVGELITQDARAHGDLRAHTSEEIIAVLTALDEVRHEIVRVGTNVNQIARAVNIDGKLDSQQTIILQNLKSELSRIVEKLQLLEAKISS